MEYLPCCFTQHELIATNNTSTVRVPSPERTLTSNLTFECLQFSSLRSVRFTDDRSQGSLHRVFHAVTCRYPVKSLFPCGTFFYHYLPWRRPEMFLTICSVCYRSPLVKHSIFTGASRGREGAWIMWYLVRECRRRRW